VCLRLAGRSRTRAAEGPGGPRLRGSEAPGAGRPSKVPDIGIPAAVCVFYISAARKPCYKERLEAGFIIR
jgi:hypothetical protein